jgi:hypothetical protein
MRERQCPAITGCMAAYLFVTTVSPWRYVDVLAAEESLVLKHGTSRCESERQVTVQKRARSVLNPLLCTGSKNRRMIQRQDSDGTKEPAVHLGKPSVKVLVSAVIVLDALGLRDWDRHGVQVACGAAGTVILDTAVCARETDRYKSR